MTSERAPSPVPLRRSLLGLRRADALRVIEDLRGQVAKIAAQLHGIWDENRALKAELVALQAELDRHSARRPDAEVQTEARVEAARLVAAAEERAALRERQAAERVGEAGTRLVDLLRLREQLVNELRGTLQSYRETLDRAGEPREEAPAPQAVEPALRIVPDLPTRRVHVDAGPFADLDGVSTFERSLAAIAGVDDVYVRAFAGGRADVELSLRGEGDPADLLGAQLPHVVTRGATDGVVVHVSPDAAANA